MNGVTIGDMKMDKPLLEIKVTFRIIETDDLDDTPFVLEYEYLNHYGGSNGDAFGYYETYGEAEEDLKSIIGDF